MAMILRWESTIVSQKVRIKLCTRQARYIFVDVCMCSCMWISVQCIELKFAESLSPYRIAQINPSRTSGKSSVDPPMIHARGMECVKTRDSTKIVEFFLSRCMRLTDCLLSPIERSFPFAVFLLVRTKLKLIENVPSCDFSFRLFLSLRRDGEREREREERKRGTRDSVSFSAR